MHAETARIIQEIADLADFSLEEQKTGLAEILGRYPQLDVSALLSGLQATGIELLGNKALSLKGAFLLVVRAQIERAVERAPTEAHFELLARVFPPFFRVRGTKSFVSAAQVLCDALNERKDLLNEAFPHAIDIHIKTLYGIEPCPTPPSRKTVLSSFGVAVIRWWLKDSEYAGKCRVLMLFAQTLLGFRHGNYRFVVEAALVAIQAAIQVLPRWPESLVFKLRGSAYGVLGRVYMERFQDGQNEYARDANIELAVSAFQESIASFARVALRLVEEAHAHTSLAAALMERTLGDLGQHIEDAIVEVNLALGFLDNGGWRKEHPQEWAYAKMIRGLLLLRRLRGDRQEDHAHALADLSAAFEEWSRLDLSAWAAVTMGAIADVFSSRSFIDQDKNDLKDAINAYWDATEYAIAASDPILVGIHYHKLAEACFEHARRLGGDSEMEAVGFMSLRRAADILKDSGLRYYQELIRLDRAQALLEFVDTESMPTFSPIYEIANLLDLNLRLEGSGPGSFFVRSAYPREWALLRVAQGQTLIRRNGAGPFASSTDLDAGFRALREALTELTPFVDPYQAGRIGRVLGHEASKHARWEDASYGFSQVVDAVEQQRRQATDNARRDEIVTSARDAYTNLVQAYLQGGLPAEALATAERAKARGLADLLASRDTHPDDRVPSELAEKLNQLRRKAEVERRRAERAKETTPATLPFRFSLSPDERSPDPPGGDGAFGVRSFIAAVESSRRERIASEEQLRTGQPAVPDVLETISAEIRDVIDQIAAIDPAFALTQAESTPLTSDEIRALLPDEHTVLLSLYFAPDVHYAFIQTTDAPSPVVIEFGKGLESHVQHYLEHYDQDKQLSDAEFWRQQLSGRLRTFAEDIDLPRILEAMPEHADRLIILPHRFTHLLPLHALPLPSRDGRCLLDRFPRGVVTAPSAALLHLTGQLSRTAVDSLVALQNPTGDLPFTAAEVTVVATFFPKATILTHERATLGTFTGSDGLLGAHVLHFACHGTFDRGAPLNSALLLADHERLTLADIFWLNLSTCRLVVLSACETGLTDSARDTEEFIGLPSGFLFAGSSAVVSSLWVVDDLSAALLSIRFYSLLKSFSTPAAPFAVAEALGQAQRWLRDATRAEVRSLIEHLLDDESLLCAAMSDILRELSGPDDERPFATPDHWAPFVALGK
ncbi:MAG TPA: CHAT domain-containing protein [Longimicrobium sp.]|jgi:CHAT domain-containing protein